jgi:hypothetical protein
MFLSSAQVVAGNRELVAHLAVHVLGDADAAGRRDVFQPRGDVDAVAVDAHLVVDHVAQVDAHAELHAAGLGHALVARLHHRLQPDRAVHRAHGARELRHDAVAGRVDDAPAELADEREHRGLVALEVPEGGHVVLAHQAGVAGDVSRQDGGQPTLDDLFRHASPVETRSTNTGLIQSTVLRWVPRALAPASHRPMAD